VPDPRRRGLTTGTAIPTKRSPDSRLTLRVEEAAALLGISRGLAYELVNRGELPALRLGRRIVVPRVKLEAFLAGTGDAVRGPEPGTNGEPRQTASDRSRSSHRRRTSTTTVNEEAGRLPPDGLGSSGD
jgi:excisionase family DNA binding protein